jgi:hypothetical protein
MVHISAVYVDVGIKYILKAILLLVIYFYFILCIFSRV